VTFWRTRARLLPGGILAVAIGALVAFAAAGSAGVSVSGPALARLLPAIAVIFAVLAARRPHLDWRTRRGWLLAATAAALLVVSAVPYPASDGATDLPTAAFPASWFPTSQPLDIGYPPSGLPQISDLARLAVAPLLIAALLSFSPRGVSHRTRQLAALDAMAVTAAAGTAFWYVSLGRVLPVLEPPELTGAIVLGYLAADLALLFVAVLVARSVSGPGHRSVGLLALAGVCEALADGYRPGGPPGRAQILLWSVGYLLLIAAAYEQWRPAGGHRLIPAHQAHHSATIIGYGAVASGYALLVLSALTEERRYASIGLVAGAGIVTGCVLARQVPHLRTSDTGTRTDALTGLANRATIRMMAGAVLRRSARTGESVGILIVDIDGFKNVNDSLGTQAGDHLLIAVANLLRNNVDREDLLSRLGSDEFGVLLRDVGSGYRAEAVAARIIRALGQPIPVMGTRLLARASIGVAIGRPGVEDTAALAHYADLALSVAKRSGGGGWYLYSPALGEQDREVRTLESELRQAVEAGALDVWYQPIVALPEGEMIGLEALVRWRHPTRGFLPPTLFIPLAERIGLISQIGNMVLERACGQVLEWQRYVHSAVPLMLDVNVSVYQFAHAGYPEYVLDTLRRLSFPPGQLVLELTESVAVNQPALAGLSTLHDCGLRIALDDFGTGYSSLAHLTKLPVDTLKIDRSFVAELNGGRDGSALCEVVMQLGEALRLGIVAEGVENTAQAAELTLLGCRLAQGYHFAKPMPAADLTALLDRAGPDWPTLPVGAPVTRIDAPAAASRIGAHRVPLTQQASAQQPTAQQPTAQQPLTHQPVTHLPDHSHAQVRAGLVDPGAGHDGNGVIAGHEVPEPAGHARPS
jgi:diguanylate cyclase (GGDEF)-like protein